MSLRALQAARDSAAEEIIKALRPALPKDFDGKLTITIRGGVVRAENVVMELRPPQGR